MYEQYLYECDCDDQAAYEAAQCDGEVEALAQQEADAAEAEHSKLKMINHIKDCSYCTFQEFDSCNCLISEKSGYESEEERNFNDDGYDGWLPCRYYLKWEDAINILTIHVDMKAAWNLLTSKPHDPREVYKMTEELLHCPFCGWHGEIREEYGPNSVHCSNPRCGAYIEHLDVPKLKGSAITAWNNRHESGELPEWLKKQIIAERDGLKDISEDIGNYIETRVRCTVAWRRLDWVLSLKKPEEEDI